MGGETIVNIGLVLVAVAAVCIAIVAVRRRWPDRLLEEHGAIGAVLAIAATVYGIIVGLTVVAVWERFLAAEVILTDELNALFAIVRMADAYPPDERERIEAAVLAYGRAVERYELGDGSLPSTSAPEARTAVRELYAIFNGIAASGGAGELALEPSYEAVMRLDAARGERLVLGDRSLPGRLWVVLLVGGGMTMMFLVLLAPGSLPVHLLIGGSTALLIGLTLALVHEMDRPFHDPIAIDFGTYSRGLRSLESEASTHPASLDEATPEAATPGAP